eukprot:scaffold304452_cov33-Tisochrysis_lutea.AAC.2
MVLAPISYTTTHLFYPSAEDNAGFLLYWPAIVTMYIRLVPHWRNTTPQSMAGPPVWAWKFS